MSYITDLESPRLADTISENVGDLVATATGWQHPSYANDWDGAVQVVYARSNYAENKRLGNSYQREYFTKSDVGATMYAYKQLFNAKKVTGYNPAASDAAQSVRMIQLNLGDGSPSIDAIKVIMREFYYAVEGSPQQIHARQLYPATSVADLTPKQQETFQRSEQSSKKAVEQVKAEEADSPSFLGAVKGFFVSIFTAPGELLGAATSSAKIFAWGVPLVIVFGVGFLLYAIIKKFGELDGNKALTAYTDTRTGKGLIR